MKYGVGQGILLLERMLDLEPRSVGVERGALERAMPRIGFEAPRVTLIAIVERSHDAAVRSEVGAMHHRVVVGVVRAGTMTPLTADSLGHQSHLTIIGRLAPEGSVACEATVEREAVDAMRDRGLRGVGLDRIVGTRMWSGQPHLVLRADARRLMADTAAIDAGELLRSFIAYSRVMDIEKRRQREQAQQEDIAESIEHMF